MAHTCHALGCEDYCPPRHLMCGRHWRMVPPELQRGVWAAYRAGQEIDKRPSPAWHAAAEAAILAVFELEGKARAAKAPAAVQLELTPNPFDTDEGP